MEQLLKTKDNKSKIDSKISFLINQYIDAIRTIQPKKEISLEKGKL